ncbi:MAG: M20/M25/M40 family metallo-hydrolase [Erysipelotrichales bacterium]|nr:M20/M25/M40 family metallo-hydrolase [Erysipelotrichales bacterium]
MALDLAKKIENIALELTSQFSVLDTKDEVIMAEKVYTMLSNIKYFQDHPENLYYVDVTGDTLGRKSVIALLEGLKDDSNKTVITIGHMDTVGISDYGPLAPYANQPLVLAEKLKEIDLPEDVRRDLASGDYLFGRGIFDMKSGDAILMVLLEKISEDIENLSGNIIFGAVCDEEGNSGGMLNLVNELCRLQEERHYEYLALLDTDYMTEEYSGDENKYIYIGTVGKLMPTFYIVGKETHVGESFKGIDPNMIAAEITRRIDLNPEFCDVVEGEVTLPPVSLKQRDLKSEYSVQIAKTACVFFNYATHSSTPDQVLEKMVRVGQECFTSVVETLNQRYEHFCRLANRPHTTLPWTPRTMTYQELCKVVREEVGESFDTLVQTYAQELMKEENIDARDRNTRIVEYIHNLWSDKDPVVIVYFSQPYYPHIYVEGSDAREKALLEAVEQAIQTTKTDYKIISKKFFPYISDLSYGAAPKEEGIIEAFMDNMPGYGIVYNLPMKQMQHLDLPVLDIGCFGKDAHKFTERVEKKYSYEVAPELVYKTIMGLLK